MPIFTYRTYPPVGSGVESREFDLEQSMDDNILITDSETGFPVKRVVKGGHIYASSSKYDSSNPSPPASSSVSSSSCCGGGCGCH